MKKTVRILIPLILALAIVLCLVWYLFVYDRAFTRDMLLYSARYFEDRGNHSVAAWFYDSAYRQSGDNDAVAIELAQQHISAGNYTKAEATLSQAIEDGGGIELYIALSKTYAEQDKLQDSVRLLDGVTNADIKAELDKLRPAAPVAVPEPGFYNQYISVTIAAETGTLYVGREYPSIQDGPCEAPITLTDGENTIYAVAVAENGLVSPLAIFGFTVGGVIEQVSFTDSAVESAVRQQLSLGQEEAVFSNQLWSITEFAMPADAVSYADLRYMTFLEKLTVANGVSGELSVLSALANLTTLEITDTSVSSDELAVIGALPKLERLTLSRCGLTTASGLKTAAGLRYLDLSGNAIRNISALSAMRTLQEASLQNNALTDLSCFSGITSLTRLNVSGNTLTDISPLAGATGLTWLDASSNQIADVSALGSLTGLTELYLQRNALTSVEALASCSALQVLQIDGNTLSDISALKSLKSLKSLSFSHNSVRTLPAFDTACALVSIDGSHNEIESLEPLAGLQNLNNVHMDYNAKLSSIKPLASCPVLIEVDVYGTAVKDVSFLTDQSVIVNFDPT